MDPIDKVLSKYRGRMLGVAIRLVGPSNADDVVQEASIKAFQSYESFRGDSHVSTWLYRIVYNVSIDYFRREKNLPLSIEYDDSLDRGGSPVRRLEARQLLERAFGVIEDLEGDPRRVLEVLAEHGTIAEAAKAIGKAPSGAHWQVGNGRRELRERFGYPKDLTTKVL